MTTASLMTVAKCKAALDATAAKKTLFWSDVARAANEALKDKTNYDYLAGYKVMRQLFTPPNFQSTYQSQFAKASVEEQTAADHAFWNSCSQALAGLAEGTLYVMLPDGTGDSKLDWGSRARSHWAQHEWPVLCRSTRVTHLYRLSAKDKTVKEDITDDMLALRTAGKCPELKPAVDAGGETAT